MKGRGEREEVEGGEMRAVPKQCHGILDRTSRRVVVRNLQIFLMPIHCEATNFMRGQVRASFACSMHTISRASTTRATYRG
eukprot:scaffold47951_cov31-Tisochrysis_lutea.AAC.3